MIATRMAPSRRATDTLWTAAEMKSDCRKMRRLISMPLGSVALDLVQHPVERGG